MGTSSTRANEPSLLVNDPGNLAEVIEALSRRFRQPLRRYFEKRIGAHAETEDLVQEVFLRLARAGDIGGLERIDAYLFTTAANLLRDRHRRLSARESQAHEPYDESLHGAAEEVPGPERAVQSTQLIEQLVAALHELPERTRLVFTLYHLEELPHAEIARRLGIAVSTIEKHVGRASAHLLKKVDRAP